jgi:hypothetical protein
MSSLDTAQVGIDLYILNAMPCHAYGCIKIIEVEAIKLFLF